MKYLKSYKIFEEQLSLFDEKTINETYKKLDVSDPLYDNFNALFLLAIDEGDLELIEKFVQKGADINYEGVLEHALDEIDKFKYFIEKGLHPSEIYLSYGNITTLSKTDYMKILLDNDHYIWAKENLIFTDEIKNDTEYDYLFDSDELGLL